LLDRYETGRSLQVNWRARWDQAAHFIAQNRRNLIMTRTSPGQELTLGVFDNTAGDCAQTLAAGMLTQTAPAGEIWFLLRPDVNEGDDGALANWLKGCSDRMARLLGSCNFYEDGFEAFMDAAVFNIGAVLIDSSEDAGDVSDAERVNFIHLPVGTFVIEEDAFGRVGALLREFEFTASQVREKFGEGALTKVMRDALNSKTASDRAKKFGIVHAVYQRALEGGSEGACEVKTFPCAGKLREWASVYVCKESRRVLLEDGFYERPFAVFRMMRGNGEIYGRGLSDKAMPVIRELNRMGRNLRTGLEKMVDPPWLLPDNTSYGIDNRPGGKMYWDSSNPNNKPESFRTEVDFRWVQQWAEDLRGQVRAAFWTEMFQMLSNPDAMAREKTAYEVSQMMQEKLVLFSPIFGRIVSEFFNPMLRRVFGIMLRARLLDAPPVQGRTLDYRVDYVSKIALAIRAAQSSSLVSFFQIASWFAQVDQAAAMVVDWRKAARATAGNFGIPADWMRDDKDIDAQLKAQQQAAMAAQLEQLAGAAQKGAGAAKNLGPDGQAAALGALGGMGGMGGAQ